MKLFLIITVCVLLLFIFSNPTIKDFKDYKGYTTYKGLRRERNFFLFSVYRESLDLSVKYIGVLSNFFELRPKSNESFGNVRVDSATNNVYDIDTTSKRNIEIPSILKKKLLKKKKDSNIFEKVPESILSQ